MVFTINIKILTILGMICMGSSFFTSNRVVTKNVKYNNNKINIYTKSDCELSDTPALLFFTGLNSVVPNNLYDDLLRIITKQNITCYVGSNNMETNEELIDDILSSHTNLTVAGHSSGCITCCNSISKNSEVTSIVLLDPVDNSFLSNEQSKPNLNQIEDILVINAKRSYEWEWVDLLPKLPFIPAFKMTSDSLKLKSPKVTLLDADNFGHTDILNRPWTDIMHNSVSRGTTDRSYKNLKQYKTWIASAIYSFIHKNNTYPVLSDNAESSSLRESKLW